MLITRLLPAACLLALTGSAQAQTATPAADTARFYRHHLGLTASPVLDGFFRNNRSLPVGLLYKRQTAPGRLLRLGIQLNQNLNNRLDGTTNPFPANIYNNFSLGMTANVGREYSKGLSKRWIATAGADLVAGYGYARFHMEGATNSIPSGELARKVRTDVDRMHSFALAPFVGIRYSLHKRVYVAAEATASLAFRRLSYKISGSTIGLTTGERTDALGGNTRYNLLNVAFKPISQIALYYLL